MTTACKYCRIVTDKFPANWIHRNMLISVFLNDEPIVPGHVIVMPNLHYEELSKVPEETDNAMFGMVCRISGMLEKELGVMGVSIYLADGKVAGSDIPHIHTHVIPRSPEDGVRIKYIKKQQDKSNIVDIAGKLAKGF